MLNKTIAHANNNKQYYINKMFINKVLHILLS